MSTSIKRTTKQLLRSLGIEIKRYVPEEDSPLSSFLESYRVETIFDVGANIGMSGEHFRAIGFEGTIVSFEPVNHLYEQLSKTSKNDPLWIAEKIALGDIIGESLINVSGGHGGSSSILSMTDIIKQNAPDQRVVRGETIQVTTLDSVIDKYYPEGDKLFVKLDVQGYEKNVLEGGKASLARIVGIKCEISLSECYDGEPLIHDMLPYLSSLGFNLVSVENGWYNPATHQLYQIDALLFRTDKG